MSLIIAEKSRVLDNGSLGGSVLEANFRLLPISSYTATMELEANSREPSQSSPGLSLRGKETNVGSQYPSTFDFLVSLLNLLIVTDSVKEKVRARRLDVQTCLHAGSCPRCSAHGLPLLTSVTYIWLQEVEYQRLFKCRMILSGLQMSA